MAEAAHAARERRTATRRDTIPSGATAYSLSRLGVSGHRGAPLHVEPARGRPWIYCCSRRQGGVCSARSTPLSALEDEIGEFLRTVTIPQDYQERLQAFFLHNERHTTNEVAGQRGRLEAQLGRLKDLDLLGDITRPAYLAQREQVRRELAVLDARDSGQATRLHGLADLLADVSRAWQVAQPAQLRIVQIQLGFVGPQYLHAALFQLGSTNPVSTRHPPPRERG